MRSDIFLETINGSAMDSMNFGLTSNAKTEKVPTGMLMIAKVISKFLGFGLTPNYNVSLKEGGGATYPKRSLPRQQGLFVPAYHI